MAFSISLRGTDPQPAADPGLINMPDGAAQNLPGQASSGGQPNQRPQIATTPRD
jgi:hypothetical protein